MPENLLYNKFLLLLQHLGAKMFDDFNNFVQILSFIKSLLFKIEKNTIFLFMNAGQVLAKTQVPLIIHSNKR